MRGRQRAVEGSRGGQAWWSVSQQKGGGLHQVAKTVMRFVVFLWLEHEMVEGAVFGCDMTSRAKASGGDVHGTRVLAHCCGRNARQDPGTMRGTADGAE